MKRQLLAALGIVVSAGSLIPASAVTPPQNNGFASGGLAFPCSVIHETPAIRVFNLNNLRVNLKKGQRIHWSGPKGQRGEFILESDLPFGKTVDAKINSDIESCTAAISSK